jgi:hypothetical protein
MFLLIVILSMDLTGTSRTKTTVTKIEERICYCSRQDHQREGSVSMRNKLLLKLMLMFQTRYHDFLTFVRNPGNGFMSLTVPFPEGFEIIVYNRDGVVSWP